MLLAKAKTKPPVDPFTALLSEAVAVTRELRALNMIGSRKLTAKAFVREAIKNAGSTPEAITALRKTLESNAPAVLQAAIAFRDMMTFIRSPNCGAPLARPRTFLAGDAALAELARLRAGFLECFAAAAMAVAEHHPEAFGPMEDLNAYSARMKMLQDKQADLYRRIETEFTPTDVQFSEPTSDQLRAEGYVRATFKISSGEVPIGPNAGERLTHWLIEHDLP